MKKNEIKFGGTYLAKVTDKVVAVRLDAENARGGWDATNLTTNKKVRIKSAARLRGKANRGGGEDKAGEQPPEVPTMEEPTNGTDAAAAPAPEASKVKKDKAPRKAKAPKTPKPPREKKMSGLDAAAKVLADSPEPMRCQAIADSVIAKGWWKTNGKTPAATLYSAMLREIQTLKGKARFKKMDRGLFAFNP